jgi:SAM-dependent methyltransferase
MHVGRLAGVDVAALKEQQAKSWGLGDYSRLSRVLEPASPALADACAVSAGQEVLDVAAGDGNFALACAREGADVVASDLAPRMVELGSRRTAEDGYDVEWVVADAEELPFEDARFDCVGSVFGAVFAPQPEVVARELFRVVRPGGTVGLVGWTPGSFAVELFGVRRRYLPPPAGLPEAELWGEEETLRARLDGLAARIELEQLSIAWEGESPEDLVTGFERDAPMQAAARAALSPEQQDAMHADLLDLVRHRNGGDGPVRIDADYLQIVARRRG